MLKTNTATAKPRRTPATAVRADRRMDILLAAEKLFAQHGYYAVSIRQIATEAEVPLALVGYYFGQKHELFHAIFEHWRHTYEERLALLAQARTAPRDERTLERMVHAFVDPVMRMRASPEGEYYALLVARELSYRTPDADRVLVDYFDPMAHAFIDALQDVCPNSSRGDAAWAYQFTLGALIHHMSDTRVRRLSRDECTPFDPAATPRLVRFVTAGIQALLVVRPPTPPPRSRSRSAT
ncbi:TetR/AcrR family transcriptional regulator [Hydrogenophaga sp.]|uniref:TetR/AcrR family transcriptional regulator n=1 Tax=Hydrogenophaga sp. TaxID=1904254 RepID=UPI003568CB0E